MSIYTVEEVSGYCHGIIVVMGHAYRSGIGGLYLLMYDLCPLRAPGAPGACALL